jgi:hypothetical protein
MKEKEIPNIADLIKQGQLPTNKTGGRTVTKTMDLRVYVYKLKGKTQHKIQQRIEWQTNRDSGEEWIDLPVVKENGA